jgi:hypothetical protein
MQTIYNITFRDATGTIGTMVQYGASMLEVLSIATEGCARNGYEVLSIAKDGAPTA